MNGAHPVGRCSALVACVLACSGAARAQTDEIQVYDAEIAAPGRFNLTWHNNFTPSGRRRAAFPQGVIPDHALNGVTEWAYGVRDWLEAATYLPLYTRSADGRLLFDGVKLRALLVVPDARDRSVFYGLNFELSYNARQWDMSRFTGEIRPILGVHLGRLDLIANPILDTDFDGLGKRISLPRPAWPTGSATSSPWHSSTTPTSVPSRRSRCSQCSTTAAAAAGSSSASAADSLIPPTPACSNSC